MGHHFSFRGLLSISNYSFQVWLFIVCLSFLFAFDIAFAAKKPASGIFPSHPRVDINWTRLEKNVELTADEKKALFESKLVLTKLIVINRHGHRSPNAAYWDFCPNDLANKPKYDVNAEDLTGLGMQEEYGFGQFLRHRYFKFLGDKFNRSYHYFRAVGEPRILESAMVVSQGLFPDGFGPTGFLPSRPQFVPIFSDMDTHEYLLDDVPCFRRAEEDSKAWIQHNFPRFILDPQVKRTVDRMHDLCGPPKQNVSEYAYIKTVADGMTFNADMNLPVCDGKLTPEDLFEIRRVSLRLLMERLYNTDEQQTYTVVDLPRAFLKALNHTRIGEGLQIDDYLNTRQEAHFYFVHRETLYALAQFFGFEYNIPGLPHGEVPVASSLIIEKLMPAKDQFTHSLNKIYVRFLLWTPGTHVLNIPIPQCRIPALCELDELMDIYKKRVERTGSWEELCNFTVHEMDHTTDIR